MKKTKINKLSGWKKNLRNARAQRKRKKQGNRTAKITEKAK
jgi:hypothetical protein